MFASPVKKTDSTKPIKTIDLAKYGTISKVCFSPYELSQDIMLVAAAREILMIHFILQDDMEMEKVTNFDINTSCTALSLSPIITNVLPNLIQFCVAGSDFKLRFFNTDLADNNACQIIDAHSDFINDISYAEESYLASVSDDFTAKIWNVNDHSCTGVVTLMSPGMSVCWHSDEPYKMVVAEKSGYIRFYNAETLKPILSVDYGKLLSCAHWAPSDAQLFVSLQCGELVFWDLARPSLIAQSKRLYSEGGGHISINPTGELVGSVNRLENQVSVIHIPTQQERLSAQIDLPANLSWHCKLPIFVVSSDTKLYFYKVVSV